MRGERIWTTGVRRALLLAVLSATALAGCGGGEAKRLSVAGPRAAGSSLPLTALLYREVFGYKSAFPIAQEAKLYRVMVLQLTDTWILGLLHQANPRLKIFLYQDIAFSNPRDDTGRGDCTAYPEVTASHPDWFLKNQGGNRIIDRSYPDSFAMDVGNVAYRQSCVRHAISTAKYLGYSGVFLDDATANINWVLSPGERVPKYPTPSNWQASMYSFLRYAAAQAHAQRVPVIANIGGATVYPGLWSRWTALLDGSEEQSFTDSGSGVAADRSTWRAQLDNARWSQLHHKYALLHSNNRTEAGNTFGLATLLLASEGQALYSTANRNVVGYERLYPEYTTAQNLGAPRGPYTELPSGVYQRAFAHGIVLVNPTSRSVGALSLGGGTYSGSGMSNVRSVSLAASSALIMTSHQ